jgi:uncharacterized protein (TIGR04562 family)
MASQETIDSQELFHEIFGSVLDRENLTPYLLRNCDDYDSALRKATLMMGNRGFTVIDGELGAGEKDRASSYVRQSMKFMLGYLFPSLSAQFTELTKISPQGAMYDKALEDIRSLSALLSEGTLAKLIEEDTRHLFMLASTAKYPHLFKGHPLDPGRVPPRWRMVACSVLKTCHLIKAIEEDSQDVYDYAQLGLFFESAGIPLSDLYDFPWDESESVPDDESARRAFVKLSSFFRKLHDSISVDPENDTLVFNSGDGVQVDIVEVKARLKSPESMFAKLGKDASEEAYDIRDILAVTFLLKSRDDSLTLFHALQKQGVILQENTASASITQTLFDTSADMHRAVGTLMRNLARREGIDAEPSSEEIELNAEAFFRSLNTNAEKNPHSSGQHRKFQCKINFSVPVHLDRETGKVVLRGVSALRANRGANLYTRQHTLPVELRISDVQSWESSEMKGEAHHSAYKCRQSLVLMNRLFMPLFSFPSSAVEQLRKDQDRLFT